MPRHSQSCTACDWRGDVYVTPYEHPPCPSCGASTERCWTGRSACVVGDDIPGGMVIENLGSEPRTFYSQRAILDAAKAQGLVNRVRHVDGDRHTSRWV